MTSNVIEKNEQGLTEEAYEYMKTVYEDTDLERVRKKFFSKYSISAIRGALNWVVIRDRSVNEPEEVFCEGFECSRRLNKW